MYEIFYSCFHTTNLSKKYRCTDHTVFLLEQEVLSHVVYWVSWIL